MFNHSFSSIPVAIPAFALTLSLAMEVILLMQFNSVAPAVGRVITMLAVLDGLLAVSLVALFYHFH